MRFQRSQLKPTHAQRGVKLEPVLRCFQWNPTTKYGKAVSSVKPRVARNMLPWVSWTNCTNPLVGCIIPDVNSRRAGRRISYATHVGVDSCFSLPRVGTADARSNPGLHDQRALPYRFHPLKVAKSPVTQSIALRSYEVKPASPSLQNSSAAIVGYVGAGGIGTWLHTYQEH